MKKIVWGLTVLVALPSLVACNRAKSVEHYLANDKDRETTLDGCGLAESSEDCKNARIADAQRIQKIWDEQHRQNMESLKRGALNPAINSGEKK